jgi:hypothetical protein
LRNRLFARFSPLVFCISLAAPSFAAAVPVHSFDAATARSVELAREAQASSPGALFRITGLRGADGGAITLDLETARLFADDFHLYVDGQDRGAEVTARLSFLRGTVEEMPRSSVALTVDAVTGAWSGYIFGGQELYEIALPGGTAEKSLAMAATVSPIPAESLAKSALSDALQPPPGTKALERPRTKVVVPPGVSYQASIAIESDYEMFQLFGDVDSAMSYLSTVIGGVSELYVRQLGISLTIASVSLYTTSNDPWNAPNPHSGATADVLCEFSSYWQAHRPLKSYPRNGAIFFTGKKSHDIGGQAFIASLCNYSARPSSCPYGGYGIIVVTGRTRDILVTAHELGHVVGSQHTHCYDPPIDMCNANEQGCYGGVETTPPDGGSVMSYCTPAVLDMGEQGHYGLDSQRVEGVIGDFIGQVGPTCLSYAGAYSLTGAAGPASATLSWTDPFTTETGWLIEQRQKSGKFTQVKLLPANATGVTITKLKHGPNLFRIRAKFKRDFGVYSDVVTVVVP